MTDRDIFINAPADADQGGVRGRRDGGEGAIVPASITRKWNCREMEGEHPNQR